MSTPIYDRMIAEREGGIPGTFTQEELSILLTARRLCSVPERLALPTTKVNRHRRVTAIVPIRTLRDKALGSEDTQEIKADDLALSPA